MPHWTDPFIEQNVTFPATPSVMIEECRTGLHRFLGVGRQPPIDRLVKRLADDCPSYLLIDVKKAGLECPANWPPATYVVDWADPLVIDDVSPRFVIGRESPGWHSMFANAWLKDAACCLYSREDPAAVLSTLRQQARGPADPRGAPSVVGFFVPSVLAQLLAVADPSLAQNLTGILDAVIIEDGKSKSWQAFSGRGFSRALKKLGFVPATPTPPANDQA